MKLGIEKTLKYKKLILAGFLPFIFWGAMLALWFFRAPEGANSSLANIGNKEKNVSIGDLAISQNISDSDRDGLSNWEEQIYGTDPNKADTDGDGYLDGEEILSRHDPLKKGPNDILPSKKSGALTKEEQNKKTTTDAFAKVALTNFLNNRDAQDFLNMSPEQLDAKLKESFKNDPGTIKEYQETMRDALFDFIPIGLDEKIKISEASSEKDEQIYANNLIKMGKDAFAKTPEYKKRLDELIIDAFEKKDFSQIDGAADYYKMVYENLLKISAPKSLAEIHRYALLMFYEFSTAMKAMKNWENDPVKTLIALKKLAFWTEKMEALEKAAGGMTEAESMPIESGY